eukprot:SAG11_NODE_721_length_7539_cov_32.292473_2_plen_50_part_00
MYLGTAVHSMSYSTMSDDHGDAAGGGRDGGAGTPPGQRGAPLGHIWQSC